MAIAGVKLLNRYNVTTLNAQKLQELVPRNGS
jgi:hypothetical protein